MIRTKCQERLTNGAAPTHTYDAAGNMTAAASGITYVFDARNRVVEKSDTDSWLYDALGQRVKEIYYPPSGLEDASRLYYSANWQLLQEDRSGFSSARVQYVWSAAYIDGLVTRYEDTEGIGSSYD